MLSNIPVLFGSFEPDYSLRYTERDLYWDDDVAALHLPHEGVEDSPGLVHAWEKHHVLHWLVSEGLGDLIAQFKAQKIIGKDLLKMTPKNALDMLGGKVSDQTTLMRVLEAIENLCDKSDLELRLMEDVPAAIATCHAPGCK